MVSRKICLLFNVGAVVSLLGFVLAQSGSTTYGVLEPGAKLMFKKEIVEPEKFLRVVTQRLVYTSKTNKISAIVIKDNNKVKGAIAELIEGGPAGKSCTLLFTSARGYGINFTVQIYEPPPNCKQCKIVDHDSSIIFGEVEKYSPLIHKAQVFEEKKLLRVVEHEFVFKKQPKMIGAVKVTDNNDKIGGKTVLKDGGPYRDFVVLHLSSQRNHGLNYTVEIFGFPPK